MISDNLQKAIMAIMAIMIVSLMTYTQTMKWKLKASENQAAVNLSQMENCKLTSDLIAAKSKISSLEAEGKVNQALFLRDTARLEAGLRVEAGNKEIDRLNDLILDFNAPIELQISGLIDGSLNL